MAVQAGRWQEEPGGEGGVSEGVSRGPTGGPTLAPLLPAIHKKAGARRPRLMVSYARGNPRTVSGYFPFFPTETTTWCAGAQLPSPNQTRTV